MVVDLETIWREFRDAVVVLSLPAERQRRVNGPGCLTCDLSEKYYFARGAFLSRFSDVLTSAQQTVIAEIDSIMEGMRGVDRGCWNDDAVRSPAWELLRKKSDEALRVFECEGAAVTPFGGTESDGWRHWKRFRDAVVVLALPAEEQPRVNGPGCLACDLLNDFHYACETFISNFGGRLTTAHRAAITEMHKIIGSMEEADYECFNDDVARRPVWERLRKQARGTLRVFECVHATVQPFAETQPGVWVRPPG